MCGISGVLAFKNSNFEATMEFLVRMRETMIHRGPDRRLMDFAGPPRGSGTPAAFHHRSLYRRCSAHEQWGRIAADRL